jgi:hypothetical protein
LSDTQASDVQVSWRPAEQLPAGHIIARGSNLNTASPTYYAVGRKPLSVNW